MNIFFKHFAIVATLFSISLIPTTYANEISKKELETREERALSSLNQLLLDARESDKKGIVEITEEIADKLTDRTLSLDDKRPLLVEISQSLLEEDIFERAAENNWSVSVKTTDLVSVMLGQRHDRGDQLDALRDMNKLLGRLGAYVLNLPTIEVWIDDEVYGDHDANFQDAYLFVVLEQNAYTKNKSFEVVLLSAHYEY